MRAEMLSVGPTGRCRINLPVRDPLGGGPKNPRMGPFGRVVVVYITGLWGKEGKWVMVERQRGPRNGGAKQPNVGVLAPDFGGRLTRLV